ncbi:MAG: hypothetical protein GXC70_01715 [Sphingomonadaceae bacterium]|nr:hypothetical protein [Sphingomonadaceae bacterium]
MADNRLLSRIARQSGGKLLNAAIDKVLPVDGAKTGKPSLLGTVAGAVALRVATRSVPGAILVGGALIAKRVYDRKQAKAGKKAESKA